MHRTYAIALLSLLLAASSLLPVYAAPERVVRVDARIVTAVPADMKVRQDAGSTVVTDAAERIVIVVKSHSYRTFEAFAQEADLEKDGFQMVGEVQSLGGQDHCFRAARTTDEGYLIADTFVRFSPSGGGAVVVAFSKESDAAAAYQKGLAITRRIQFKRGSATRTAGGGTSGRASSGTTGHAGGSHPYAAALRGKHLVYLYTGNGYSERKDLYLLANGAFITRADASSLSMNGSGVTASNADGTWQVTADGQLEMRGNDGSVVRLTIAPGRASNEVLLNGTRFFIMSE